jgi:hypothetical protein
MGGMQLLGFSFSMTVPSIGDRPPVLHVGTEVSVKPLHLVILGAIATAIVWVALTAKRPVESPAEPDVTFGARLTRA